MTDVDSQLDKHAETDTQPSAPRPAHLGVANEFVYCDESHRWVLPGTEAAGEEPQITAPPTMDAVLGSGLPSDLHHLVPSNACGTANPSLQRRLSLTQRYVDTFHSITTSEIIAACPTLPMAPMYNPQQPPDICAFACSSQQSQSHCSSSQTQHSASCEAVTGVTHSGSDLRVVDQGITVRRVSDDYSLCRLSGTAPSLVASFGNKKQDQCQTAWQRTGESGPNSCNNLLRGLTLVCKHMCASVISCTRRNLCVVTSLQEWEGCLRCSP